ncbi:sensor histidine kinase, partial [Planctomycetota bacterium]
LVQSYLDIERSRFGDQLRIFIDVPSELEAVLVPSFCLQPLVENAVKHGLEETGGGEIRLSAIRLDTNQVLLQVWDNGRGTDGTLELGIGLGNTRERLLHLYGGQADIEVTSSESGGVAVRLKIPIRFNAAGQIDAT